MAAITNSTLAGPMIMNTGKSINDLGDMDGCEATKGLKFGAFQLITTLAPFYLGA